MERKIAIGGWILALAAMVSELGRMFQFRAAGYFNMISFSPGDRWDFGNANPVNLFFMFLLLGGAALYSFSKYREMRLLRFIFSILVLLKLIVVIFVATFLLMQYPQLKAAEITYTTLFLIAQLLIIAFCFVALKHFQKVRTLDYEEKQYENTTEKFYLPANNWERFFHLIVDLLVTGLLFFPVFKELLRTEFFQEFARTLESGLGERFSLLLIVLFFRTIYYVLYESIFGATPAKMLSENRVVNDDIQHASVGTIFTRTFCRYIPFEPFSFFASANWHDQYSRTEVIREKRTGTGGGWYFFIIPVSAVLLFFMMKASVAIEKNVRESKESEKFELQRDEIKANLARLSTNDIIRIKDVDHDASEWLKVENISGGTITVSQIQPLPRDTVYIYADNSVNEDNAERAYNFNKGKLRQIQIPIKKLQDAIIEAYKNSPENYESRESFAGINLLGDERKYYVENIESYFMPRLVMSNESIAFADMAKIYVANRGWNAEVVSIKQLSGDMKLDHDKAPFALHSGNSLAIMGEGGDADDLKIAITVKDSLGRQLTYEIRKVNDELLMTKTR